MVTWEVRWLIMRWEGRMDTPESQVIFHAVPGCMVARVTDWPIGQVALWSLPRASSVWSCFLMSDNKQNSRNPTLEEMNSFVGIPNKWGHLVWYLIKIEYSRRQLVIYPIWHIIRLSPLLSLSPISHNLKLCSSFLFVVLGITTERLGDDWRDSLCVSFIKNHFQPHA